jgi:hypothetical protein
MLLILLKFIFKLNLLSSILKYFKTKVKVLIFKNLWSDLCRNYIPNIYIKVETKLQTFDVRRGNCVRYKHLFISYFNAVKC